MNRRLFGAAALAVAASLASTSTASAETVGTPDNVHSVWVQPGTAPLDGVGAYLYIAPDPTPDPSQLAPAYEYVVLFSYEGSSSPGGIGLGTQPDGTKIAAIATGGGPTMILPYDWSPGHLYFLLAYNLGAGAWGGWVLDVWGGQWTFLGQTSTPVEWGRLSLASRTTASWAGDGAEPHVCSQYPQTDAFFTPVIGVRDGSFTLGSLAGEGSSSNGCPSEISSFLGWAHYRLGQ